MSHPKQQFTTLYEAEVAPGLEPYARDEIKRLFGGEIAIRYVGAGGVRFAFEGKPGALLRLQTVIAVYRILDFPVPRPKALLGHEHFSRLLREINAVRVLSPRTDYDTFYISAAGSESAIMTRLKAEIAAQTGLSAGTEKGDLWMRLRRSKQGWEILLRLTARPLATRAWRVCNFEGALNASVAHVMTQLTEPDEHDVFLNLLCGSGSLLIERLFSVPAQQIIGCDINPAALDCARANLAAAHRNAVLLHTDARQLPLPDNSIDALCADFPFGQLVGTHAENLVLYPALLQEAARVARPNAHFVLITHEVRLIESLLYASTVWQPQNVLRVSLGGLHPRIYVLRKR
ncbi:MAG: RNA methyltransferase [Chloroflexi bacterium]|nr:RNA methyltransferase [Chloroflexota bacterium]